MKYVKIASVLGAISLFCALIISLFNLLTSPIIKDNNKAKEEKIYKELYSEYDSKNSKEIEDLKGVSSDIIKIMEIHDSNDNILGFVYTVEGKNAYGGISLMVAIEEGPVCKQVEFLSNTESFASKVADHVRKNYPQSESDSITISPYDEEEIADVSSLSQDDVSLIDVKCGATYGATLVRNLVQSALDDAKGRF